MKKRTVKRMAAAFLAGVLTIAALPSSVSAQGTDGGAYVPTRVLIVSETDPSGTELGQRVSLAAAEFMARDICSSLNVVYGAADQAKEGDLVVRISTDMDAQAYEIAVNDGTASVTSGSPAGLLYGLRNILKSCMRGEPVSDVQDAPDVEQRIFHLDCGRKYFSKEWIQALIREISWLGMNQLELDFSNGSGFRFALEDMNLDIDGNGTTDVDLSSLPGGTHEPDKYLTQSEMDEIIDTADQYGIEVIPSLDTPGHTGWIMAKFPEYGNGDVEIGNETSTSFAKALVKKYAAYFVAKGCKTFHIGGDEYLHAAYNWGTPVPSTENQYGAMADYLDGLARELKELGVEKVRSFNDPLYYNDDMTTHKYEYIDEATVWCYKAMGGFNYGAPDTIASQGIGLINGHGDFYDILTGGSNNSYGMPEWKIPVGDANTWKTPAGIYANFQNNEFAKNSSGKEVHVDDEYVKGATYFLWCDDSTQGNETEVAVSLYPRLRSASTKMWDESASGSYEDFAATFTDSVGGFTEDGALQESALPETGDIQKAEPDAPDPGKPDPGTSGQQGQKKTDIASATIMTIAEQSYTGSAITPAVTVILGGKTLRAGTDYTAAYQNNVNIGTASVTVTGKGDYTGSLTAHFSIRAKAESVWKIGNFRYTITAVNADGSGEAALSGVAVKKAQVKVQNQVQIGGKTFHITAIAAKAFQNDGKLKKITIGTNVAKIGKGAFQKCKNLKTVVIRTKKLTQKSVGKNAFSGIFARASVNVPEGKKAAYRKFLYKKGLPKKARVK